MFYGHFITGSFLGGDFIEFSRGLSRRGAWRGGVKGEKIRCFYGSFCHFYGVFSGGVLSSFDKVEVAMALPLLSKRTSRPSLSCPNKLFAENPLSMMALQTSRNNLREDTIHPMLLVINVNCFSM